MLALNKTTRKNYRFDAVTMKLLDAILKEKIYADETKTVQAAVLHLATEKLGEEKVQELKKEAILEQLEQELEE